MKLKFKEYSIEFKNCKFSRKLYEEEAVKKFWKKEVLPFCPDDEEKWEDLPFKEKRWIYRMYKEIQKKEK